MEADARPLQTVPCALFRARGRTSVDSTSNLGPLQFESEHLEDMGLNNSNVNAETKGR